jgi:hypothetical protein
VGSRCSRAAPHPLRFCRQPKSDVGGEAMDWARILAFVTGTVDQELLARIEYLLLPGDLGLTIQVEKAA